MATRGVFFSYRQIMRSPFGKVVVTGGITSVGVDAVAAASAPTVVSSAKDALPIDNVASAARLAQAATLRADLFNLLFLSFSQAEVFAAVGQAGRYFRIDPRSAND